MTPDDVVARARELEGKEVDITVRGVVQRYTGESWGVSRPSSGLFAVSLTSDGRAVDDLVDIQPAPLRIEPGELYRNGAGELLRGDEAGGLQGFDGYIGADEITADSELVRVRVVEA